MSDRFVYLVVWLGRSGGHDQLGSVHEDQHLAMAAVNATFGIRADLGLITWTYTPGYRWSAVDEDLGPVAVVVRRKVRGPE